MAYLVVKEDLQQTVCSRAVNFIDDVQSPGSHKCIIMVTAYTHKIEYQNILLISVFSYHLKLVNWKYSNTIQKKKTQEIKTGIK